MQKKTGKLPYKTVSRAKGIVPWLVAVKRRNIFLKEILKTQSECKEREPHLRINKIWAQAVDRIELKRI